MEKKQIQYYNFPKTFGKDDKYLKGNLQYLYDSDEKKEHITPDKWKLVNCAETAPQEKHRVDCGAFVCIFCYYISHDSCLDFDESIIAKFQKTIALSILNVKEAGDRSDVTQSSQVHPIAAETSESIAVRVLLKDLLKFVKSRLVTKYFQELLLKMNCMLPNCKKNYPKILEDFSRIC